MKSEMDEETIGKELIKVNDELYVEKSTALVLRDTNEPNNFALLKSNTNLNSLPHVDDWLNSPFFKSPILHPVSCSSFRIAQLAPDVVGKVDVISDCDNIKNILKMPYSSHPLSMIVHRICNTVLLDDLDITKLLSGNVDEEWKGLSSFFRDHIFAQEPGLAECMMSGTFKRYTLQEEILNSKFLHYSCSHPCIGQNYPQIAWYPKLPEPGSCTIRGKKFDDEKEFTSGVHWKFENTSMLLGTRMPIFGDNCHPSISLRLREASKSINVLTGIDYWLDNLMCNVPEIAMCFHIEGMVQNYKVCKTEELPDLEDATFSPTIIKDVAQNILAFLKSDAYKNGHTYWLFKAKEDDVMKLYDLTSLCFDGPRRGKKKNNPFAMHVAFLLYRVARNMIPKRDSDGRTIRVLLKYTLNLMNLQEYPEFVSTAHYMYADSLFPTWLCNDLTCDDLVQKIENVRPRKPKMVSGQKNHSPVRSYCITEPFEPTERPVEEEEDPEITGNLERRCEEALRHLEAGIGCLKYWKPKKGMHHKLKEERRKIKMANTSGAIPLPYCESNEISTNHQASGTNANEELVPANRLAAISFPNDQLKDLKAKKSKKSIFRRRLTNKMDALLINEFPTGRAAPHTEVDWKNHLFFLLTEKSCIVYTVLMREHISRCDFARALSCIRHILSIRALCDREDCEQESRLKSFLCKMAVNCYGSIAQTAIAGACAGALDVCYNYRGLIQNVTQLENPHHSYVIKQIDNYKMSCGLPSNPPSQIAKLLPTKFPGVFDVYKTALSLAVAGQKIATSSDEKKSFYVYIGSINCELGKLTSERITELIKGNASRSTIENLFKETWDFYEESKKAFVLAEGHKYASKMLLNCGHTFRQWAAYYIQTNFRFNIGRLFEMACCSYEEAFQLSGSRKKNPLEWYAIEWELSTTRYTIAKLAQDRSSDDSWTINLEDVAPSSWDIDENALSALLRKALDSCPSRDFNSHPRYVEYQIRKAHCFRRLGTLHQQCIRSNRYPKSGAYTKTFRQPKQRTNLSTSLMASEYDKAERIFLETRQFDQFLRVKLEKIAFFEFRSQNCDKFGEIMKELEKAFAVFAECEQVLIALCEEEGKLDTKKVDNKEFEDDRSEAIDINFSSKDFNVFEYLRRLDVNDDVGFYVRLLICRLRCCFLRAALACKSHNAHQMRNAFESLYRVSLQMNEKMPLAELLEVVASLKKKSWQRAIDGKR